MSKKTGGGSALFAGADFQARLGAYALTSVITSTACSLYSGDLTSISFETGEAVDDLLLVTTKGNTYVQAKRSVSFSKASGSALLSTLSQFAAQDLNGTDRLVLATTSKSSKKITRDLKTALDRFRTADRLRFERDQPKAIVDVIVEFLELLTDGLGCDPTAADRITRCAHVIVVDVEKGDPHARGLELMLEAHKFKPGTAIFGKIITDCIEFAKERNTIDVSGYVADFASLKISDEADPEQKAADLFNIIQQGELSVGREILLCSLPDNSNLPIESEGPVLFEIYRFDDNCDERLIFNDESVTFLDGTHYPLHARCSTFAGMTRLLQQSPEMIGDSQLVIMGINSEEDFDSTNCAAIHKERLLTSLKNNEDPLACLRCGEYISTNDAHLVEIGTMLKPTVGFIHPLCRQPSDRVIGAIMSELFKQIVDLSAFDVEGWYNAVEFGQRAFANADYISSGRTPYLVWGGFSPKPPPGGFMIEIVLKDGTSEIITERNKVHRFTKKEAEEFSKQLNDQFELSRSNNDPFCYTDQSKAFGPKSQLIEQLGFLEKTREVDEANPRKFDALIAEPFESPGQWYAPVFYLTDEDGQPIEFEGGIFLLTDPLKANDFLANWRQCFDLPEEFGTRVLSTDDQFDEFARWCCLQGFAIIVDPILQNDPIKLISGIQILPLENFEQEEQEEL